MGYSPLSRSLLAKIVFAAISGALLCAPVHARWKYSAKTDPFSDEKASTASKSNPGRYGASLIVRCREGFLEAYYVPASYLGSSDYADVRFRFDKLPPESTTWSISTSGQAVFSDSAAEFARMIVEGAALVIEAKDFGGTPHIAKFSLSGSAGPVGRVLSDCQIRRQDPRETDPEVWRRVAQSLDDQSVEGVRGLGGLLDTLFPKDAPHGDRTGIRIYRSLSDIYSTMIYACENELEFADGIPSCEKYRSRRKYDQDADYPVEAVPLFLEIVKKLNKEASDVSE